MKLRTYTIVTGAYWAFTVADGALRLLVLLHFHQLGYSPVSIAFLFLAYELMGVVTNLIGGWLGARSGLNRTLTIGLGLQIVALIGLTFHRAEWSEWLSVGFVMGAQALAGVAKDLTKMSSKSAVKFLAGEAEGALFRLVAVLTGSKNALKGAGFFIGAALLSWIGYDAALWTMAGLIGVALVTVTVLLDEDIGRSSAKPPLGSILSKSAAINRLAAARFFLFGSRDIWFVVAVPVFLAEVLGWSFERIGGFLALWIIGYGIVQSLAPRLLRRQHISAGSEPAMARTWALALVLVSILIATMVTIGLAPTITVVGGLIVFGMVFALNSSLHSFLILAYSNDDEVALDVGFYYSANATGRFVGTLLSGLLYLWGGLETVLWASAAFVVLTWLFTRRLSPLTPVVTSTGR